MAHEIAHVRNRDVRLMSLAAVLVGVDRAGLRHRSCG